MGVGNGGIWWRNQQKWWNTDYGACLHLGEFDVLDGVLFLGVVVFLVVAELGVVRRGVRKLVALFVRLDGELFFVLNQSNYTDEVCRTTWSILYTDG